jgi:hypothetical protein
VHGGGVAGVRLNGPPGPYSSRFLSRGDARDIANSTPCSVRGYITAARRDCGGADRPTPASDSRGRGGTEKGEKGRIGCLPPHEAPRHAVIEEEVAVRRVNIWHDELELGNGGGVEAELADGALRWPSGRLGGTTPLVVDLGRCSGIKEVRRSTAARIGGVGRVTYSGVRAKSRRRRGPGSGQQARRRSWGTGRSSNGGSWRLWCSRAALPRQRRGAVRRSKAGGALGFEAAASG